MRKIKAIFRSGDVVVVDGGVAKTIADMQRDIDAYRFVYGNLIGYLDGKFGDSLRFKPAILIGLASSKEVNDEIDMLCNLCFTLGRKYEELKEKVSESEIKE